MLRLNYNLFKPIVSRLQKPFYVKSDFAGKTLLMPYIMKLFYAIGYNPMSSDTYNLTMILIFLACQMFATPGEALFIRAIWGDFVMFTGLASLIYGLRTSIVICVILYWHKKYKEAFDVFATKIWISAEEDPQTHNRCESRLALTRIVCYIKVGVVYMYVVEPFFYNIGLDYVDKNFPLTVEYFFDIHVPYVFEFVFAVMAFDITVRVIFVANMDLTMNYYVVHTSVRFQNLAEAILNVNNEENCSDDKLRRKISEIVQRHNELRSFAGELQDLFSVSILMQFIADVFLICVMGAQLAFVTMPLVAKVKIGTFLVTVYAQHYVNCDSGEMLTEASMKLGDAAYHSAWLNRMGLLGTPVVLIMQYAQCPLRLSGCGFFELSMLTFAAVCRRSASYFMLIRTLFE